MLSLVYQIVQNSVNSSIRLNLLNSACISIRKWEDEHGDV